MMNLGELVIYFGYRKTNSYKCFPTNYNNDYDKIYTKIKLRNDDNYGSLSINCCLEALATTSNSMNHNKGIKGLR